MYTHYSTIVILLGLAGFVSVLGEKTNGKLVNQWYSGFKMNIRLQLLEKVTGGWSITLRFTKPAPGLQIWRAKIVSVSDDMKEYQLKNMPWNRNLPKCEVFSLTFLADKTPQGSANPDATVEFNRISGSNTNLNEAACTTTSSPAPTFPTTISRPPTPSLSLSSTILPPATTQTIISSTPFSFGPLVIDQTTTATIVDDWNGGFKMVFKLFIQHPVNEGWIIKIVFSKPVRELHIWKAIIVSVSSDKKTYIVKNKLHNKVLAKCTVLEIDFMGNKEVVDEDAPDAHVTFYRYGPHVPTSDSKICAMTTYPITSRPSTGPATNPATNSPPTSHQTTKGQTKPDIGTTSFSTARPSSSPYDYSEVLHASILFYEAQRSGKLPPSNRIPWRGDSALSDHGDNGEDLTGGWYDAGDFVKFGFPMASSVTVLAWGILEFRDAYKAAGELDNVLDSIKWATDYFVKAHTAKFEFYGQVGDGDVDHAYWGRPEDMTMKRPAFKITKDKPGSDLAAETAAALAAASMCFAQTNQNYANILIKHAEELYEFADRYRGKYSDSITNAASFYASHSGFKDELVWGAAWLYKATMKQTYLTKAEQYYTQYEMKNKAWAFSWDDKKAGVQLLLAEITGKSNYEQDVQTYLDSWLPGGDVSYTPKGFAWRDKWGPNRYSANTAFLALVAAKVGLKPQAYRNFATKQIHYMLGDSGRSFVVGFGPNPPLRPHHRSSSCPSKPAACTWNDFNNPDPNPQVLTGALVGGPDKNDNYVDKRSDYIMNEVATDYNAGFQSAVAGLKQLTIA